MSFLSLVLVNLGRNKLRTILTLLSVTVALFLFCSLEGVLDTLAESIRVGSETRLVTRNKISLVFPIPIAYRQRIQAVPGIRRVGIQNWFGGQDPKDPRAFFAQFGVDPEIYPIYARDIELVGYTPAPAGISAPAGQDPKLAAYFADQTACIVGQDLMEKHGWKLGQSIALEGTIYPGSWPFTIRGVYRAKNKAFGEQTMLFHWKYLDQKGMGGQSWVGIYVLDIADPGRAGDIAHEVDAMFENSGTATRTETERAFQAGFVSMYGNIPFALRVIGLAVAFSILLIAANTMMMAFRERTSEIGVMKTLGFEDGTVFKLVLAEAAIITLGGGVLGSLLAKFAIERSKFNAGGMLPPMQVHWETVLTGIGIALLIGAVSGILPAWQAAKLTIVNALRRV